jgi:hypothetical protein
VPWQGGVRIGVVAEVVDVSVAAALELREAVACLDEAPWLLAPARRMIAAQAARTAAPVGLALATMLPVGLDVPLATSVRRLEGVDAEALGEGADALASGAWQTPRRSGEALGTWREHGLVEERVRVRPARERMLRARRRADAELAGRAREPRSGGVGVARGARSRGERGRARARRRRRPPAPRGRSSARATRAYAEVERAAAGPAVGRRRAGGAGRWRRPRRATRGASLSTAGTATSGWRPCARESPPRWSQARHQALVLVPEAARSTWSPERWPPSSDAGVCAPTSQPEVARSALAEAAAGTPLRSSARTRCSPRRCRASPRSTSGTRRARATSSSRAPAASLVATPRCWPRRAHVLADRYDVLATAELRAQRLDRVESLPYPAPRLVTSTCARARPGRSAATSSGSSRRWPSADGRRWWWCPAAASPRGSPAAPAAPR